jgi:hypothetical protein
MTEVHTAIAAENARHSAEEEDGAEPKPQLQIDLDVLEPRIGALRERFVRDAQRVAQGRYAAGMALGTFALWAVCVGLGVGFAIAQVKAIYGVGLMAGGVGAVASVLQRMRSERFTLNFQVGPGMLRAFGAVRPLLGGVFGMVIFCIIRAELVTPLKLPSEPGAAIAYVVVFAFLAGFNERFFRDILAGASQGYSEEGADRSSI